MSMPLPSPPIQMFNLACWGKSSRHGSCFLMKCRLKSLMNKCSSSTLPAKTVQHLYQKSILEMVVSGDNTWVLWQLFIPSQNKMSFTSQQCFKIQCQKSTQVAYIGKLVPTNSSMGTDFPTVKLAIPLFEVCAFDGQFSECSPSECGPLLIILLPYTPLPNTFNE